MCSKKIHKTNLVGIILLFLPFINYSQKGKELRFPLENGKIVKSNSFLSIDNSKGIYIASDNDTLIRSCTKGKVSHIGFLTDSSFFIFVIDKNDNIFKYFHLKSTSVNIGQIVDQGTMLGIITKKTNLFFGIYKGLTPQSPKKFLVFK